MSQKFEISRTTGMHAQLNKLAGNWAGIVKTWFEPGEVADESPVQGAMRLVFYGKFIIHEYTGSFGGKPLEGLAIIGYDLNTQRLQCAWIDSFHNGTAIMFSQAKGEGPSWSLRADAPGRVLFVTRLCFATSFVNAA